MAVQTWLVDMPEEECAALLAGATLGRLAVIVDGRPEIFPVNHIYDWGTHSVLFPTSVGTKLHGALDWPWVAYEVDGLDADGTGGWSVLVVGRAELVTDAEEIDRAVASRTVLWGAGNGRQWIRIVASKTSGRRISAVVRQEAGSPHGLGGAPVAPRLGGGQK